MAAREKRHRKRSRNWLLIVIISILVVIAVAVISSPSQTVTQTSVLTIRKLMGNTIWSNQLVLLNGTMIINATLNPDSKTGYGVIGSIQDRTCVFSQTNVTCARITFLVLNRDELGELRSGSVPQATYLNLTVLDQYEHPFTLDNLDHNGIYSFVFEYRNSPVINPLVMINLSEGWTQTQTTTETSTITSSYGLQSQDSALARHD